MTPDHRELMARALHELQRAQQRIDELEARDHAPLPIVGLACRLPRTIDSAAELWSFLKRGGHVADEIPADRWDVDRFHDPEPGKPGRIAPRRAALLGDIRGFDAAFFGIAPREAELMDPQQRLLLEVAWHAFEDAGLPPARVAGTPIGVFLGISTVDYGYHLVQNLPPEHVTGHAGTGTNHAVAAGRIAYLLDLRGPCVALDTACSSSLVALHLAAQSLRRGECQAALVLGVNAILSPLTSASFSHARMLAPDGRCKTFDASADGYGRGEGAVAVLLTTRTFASQRGLRARAELLGSAVNQDGRSAGLTVPNGPAQEAVLRAALAAARCAPGDIDFVEAHGTGTALGDPIEIGALAGVFAAAHAENRPLFVSASKTNLGHTEAAAGLLGVAKTMLQIQHGDLVPHLHLQRPNPHVPWDRLPIRIPTTPTPWPPGARRAGVSSFGFSGTNAHVILGAAPAGGERVRTRPVLALPLSAASPSALGTLALAWEERLRGATDDELVDLVWTAAEGRSLLRVRAVALGNTVAELGAHLGAMAAGQVLGTHHDPAVVAAAQAFVRGDAAALPRLLAPGRIVDAPLYPFERVPAWIGRATPTAAVELLLEDRCQATAAAPTTAEGLRWRLTGSAFPEEWRSRLAVVPDGAPSSHWLHFVATTSPPIDASVTLLSTARAALAAEVRQLCVLVASPPTESPTVMAVRAAVRAMAVEQPQLDLRLLVARSAALPTLLAALHGEPGERIIDGERLLRPRWCRLPLGGDDAMPMATEGTFLLAGGTGALGTALAAWLLRAGVRHLVLASRSATVPDAELRQQAGALGATLTVRTLDVTDATAVHELVATLAAATPPLRAVFHLAGSLDDALVPALTAERIRAAMAAKVLGAQWLHEATSRLPLHTFVCASSAVAWFGNVGQSAYAAANGALIGLCHQRRAAGLPALALAFGPIAEGGMAADPALRQRWRQAGITPLRIEDIGTALRRALRLPIADAALVHVDWTRFARWPAATVRQALHDLAPTSAAAPSDDIARWRALPRDEGQAWLATALAAAVTAVLGQPGGAVRADTPLATLGLDSLLATDLRLRIRADLGLEAPFALLLAATDCQALARELLASASTPPRDADDATLQCWIAGLTDAQVAEWLARTPPPEPT
ncbi:MAG: SDR family NAD(P)-dependent oxidoreductase [Planctomycetes bacterium]|nr:SDR family NAD(P)-dependent oxidoreductase [Planctomycetota bacterium]